MQYKPFMEGIITLSNMEIFAIDACAPDWRESVEDAWDQHEPSRYITIESLLLFVWIVNNY